MTYDPRGPFTGTDHTAHIEECEREREAAFRLFMAAPTSEVTSNRHRRAVKAHERALLDAYGVPCPVEACEDGWITTGEDLPQTTSSPAEPQADHCDYCDRGRVLPARADAYEGET